MIEYLSSPQDVIAVRIGGKLQRQELASLVDRMAASLAERETTHVFAEVTQLAGFELEGVADPLRRAMPMLGQLKKFGRIAVVADQRWLRGAARLESALLPHVSYEVFTPDQRERALRWVAGEIASARGPALSLIETDNPAVVGFEVDGRLTQTEIRAMRDYLSQRLAQAHPPGPPQDSRLNLLARMKRLDGVEAAGVLERDFIAMKREMIDRIDRYAIVGGPAWLRHGVNLLDGLLRIELRHFEADAEAQAWQWLGARPLGQRTLVD